LLLTLSTLYAAEQRSPKEHAPPRPSKGPKRRLRKLAVWRCIAPDTGRRVCFRVAESDRTTISTLLRKLELCEHLSLCPSVGSAPLLTLCRARRTHEKKKAPEVKLHSSPLKQRLCAYLSNGQAFDRRPCCFGCNDCSLARRRVTSCSIHLYRGNCLVQ
jgi:hypothetical protein